MELFILFGRLKIGMVRIGTHNSCYNVGINSNYKAEPSKRKALNMQIICNPKFEVLLKNMNAVVRTSNKISGIQLIDNLGEVRNLSIDELQIKNLRSLISREMGDNTSGSVVIGQAHGSKVFAPKDRF